MRILGVDAPRGWSCLDVPNIGRARVVSMGTLDDGAECENLAAMISKYSPDRVIVEAPLEPYVNGKASDGSPGVRRSILISLLATARLAGELRQVARAMGIWSQYVDAATVRRALGIRGDSETAIDRAVKACIEVLVIGWPGRTNVDERDAAAACIYGARMPSK